MLPTVESVFGDDRRYSWGKSDGREALEERFFSAIRLSNGVHKLTWSGRLDDVDQSLLVVFRRLGVAPSKFLDVGVSSGIATAQWLDTLQEAGLSPSMTATDLTMNAYLVKLYPWLYVLVDREGCPLHYDLLGGGFRPRTRIRYYVFGGFFLTLMFDRVYRKMSQRLGLSDRLAALEGNPPRVDDPVIKAQIRMVTHRLRHNKAIELLDDDITKPTPRHLQGQFEVIRAANILNWCYFTSRQLRDCVENLRDRLVGPGGLLLIVRTEHGNGNHGSVFRLNEKGSFDLVSRVGKGSEIEDLVLSTT